MQRKQKQTDVAPKKPQDKAQRGPRKPYTSPKLTVHGSLGQITAGSGGGWAKP